MNRVCVCVYVGGGGGGGGGGRYGNISIFSMTSLYPLLHFSVLCCFSETLHIKNIVNI